MGKEELLRFLFARLRPRLLGVGSVFFLTTGITETLLRSFVQAFFELLPVVRTERTVALRTVLQTVFADTALDEPTVVRRPTRIKFVQEALVAKHYSARGTRLRTLGADLCPAVPACHVVFALFAQAIHVTALAVDSTRFTCLFRARFTHVDVRRVLAVLDLRHGAYVRLRPCTCSDPTRCPALLLCVCPR